MSESADPRTQQRIDWLRQVTLLQDIVGNATALAELASITEERPFPKGSKMTEEGKSGSDLFLLVRGTASVNKLTLAGDTYRVATISADQHAFFGEGGLLDNEARSATIVAESDCVCLVLAKPAFDKFAEKNPQWAFPIMARITQKVMSRLRKANADLLLLYNALVTEVRGDG
ncbi:MAG: Crp/Fnr family transcriptional regulator [Bdellovibrionales bacterium]|nr:Crp/Fnr family transcriptional regulator [Bdellovibrionales bacterium]